MRMKVRKVIDKFNEALGNNNAFNYAVTFGALLLQSVCTVALFTASYFRGMRRGVDITDSYYTAEVTNG